MQRFSHLLTLTALAAVGVAALAAVGVAAVPPGAATPAAATGRTPPQSTTPVGGPVRFVSTGAGSRLTIDAAFPPVAGVCQANQPHDLQAAYPGTLEVGRESNGNLYLITELTFPQYLKGIAEMPVSWPIQALEAQVVAARTYAISHMSSGHVGAVGYDLCSTDSCQVYRGLQLENGAYVQDPNWAAAVDDTAGQILEYQGRPIDAFYFSTSNGHTYAASDVFGGSNPPYLQPVPEADDTASPTSSWSVRMPLTDVAAILRLAGAWGAAPIDAVDQQGDDIVVTGGGTSTTMPLSTFRNRLNNDGTCLTPKRYPTAATGWSNLPQVVPSVWMTLAQSGDAIVMTGRGWGHGVGMVQWGAKGKADRGLSYSQILSYYYGGLTPAKVAEPGGIRVLLATGVHQVTVAPSGPVRIDGAGTPAGTLTITGGSSMTISSSAPPAAPSAPPAAPAALVLSGVTVTATAMPGQPAGFSFNLNHPANVSITYQQPGVTNTGTVPPVPLQAGAQTIPWDPLAAGLAPGTYTAALVADDGVTHVVSPSFQIVVSVPSPPSPSPSRSTLAAGGARSTGTKVPAPLLIAAGALALVVLLGAGGFLALRRGRGAGGPPPPGSSWTP